MTLGSGRTERSFNRFYFTAIMQVRLGTVKKGGIAGVSGRLKVGI
jgi:hypothetical protein